MSTKVFTIKNYYEREIPIDDGVDGEAVAAGVMLPIRIRRFTVAMLQAFQRGFERLNNPTSQRFIHRVSDGDEQTMREVQAIVGDKGLIIVPAHAEHVVPDAEIERRRLVEMSPETRAAYEAAKIEDDQFMATFCSEVITAYVSVAPGFTLKAQREDSDELFQVTTGKDLVEAFGGNLSMLLRMTMAIHEENTLSPEKKRRSRLRSGLTASSPMPAAAVAADGATPAATATSAAAEDSAPSGDAPADPVPIPSGSGELVSTT